MGKILIEGKTKKVYDLPDHPGLCLLLSKDRITAFDGLKAHELQGKAAISNTTNGLVLGYSMRRESEPLTWISVAITLL